MGFFDELFGIDMNADGKVDLVDAMIFNDLTTEEEEEELEAYLTTVDEEEDEDDR